MTNAELIAAAMSGASPPKCPECFRCIACRAQNGDEGCGGCDFCDPIVEEIRKRELGHLLPDHRGLALR